MEEELPTCKGLLERELSLITFASFRYEGLLARRCAVGGREDEVPRALQNPLIKEYTLNYNRIPNIILCIFLN